jgi:hypothetical protein
MVNAARLADSTRSKLISLLNEKVAMADMAFARSFAVGREEATSMVVKAVEQLDALPLDGLPTEASPESDELARLRAAIEKRRDALECRLRELVPTRR